MTGEELLMRTSIAALALLCAIGAPASASEWVLIDPDAQYSATRVMEAEGQRIEQQYYHQSALRNRADTEMKGQRSSMIVRADRNVVWLVAPAQRMYMEMSLMDPQTRARLADIPDSDAINEYRLVGSEDVNGVAAEKFHVSARDAKGTEVEGYFWIEKKHRIPVKMDLSDGAKRAVMELRDLKVGPQPATLFEPPSGYQRMAFGGVPGLGGLTGGKSAAPAQPVESPAPAAESSGAAPGFAEEVATEAANEAESEVKRKTREEVRRTVRQGLDKLLGR